jgi:hypothetical protein
MLSGVPPRPTPPAPDPDAIEDRLSSALGVSPPETMGAPGPRAWWRGLDQRKRRRLRNAAIAAGVVVIALSVVLARFLQTENVERDADLALIEAQTRGDVPGMLDKLDGCRSNPSCVASVHADVANARLRPKGTVRILQVVSKTAYALDGATGETRLAWKAGTALPVVQCVNVRRTGNFLTGVHIQLIGLSGPIQNEGVCGKRTTQETEELEEDRALGQ